jgi:hypothetical protein
MTLHTSMRDIWPFLVGLVVGYLLARLHMKLRGR